MFSFQIEKVDRQDNDAYKTQHYLQTDFWADFKSMHGWKKMLYKVNAKCESTDFSFSGPRTCGNLNTLVF